MELIASIAPSGTLTYSAVTSNRIGAGELITMPRSATIERIQFNLRKKGSPAINVSAQVWSVNSYLFPETLLYTSDTVVDSTTLTTTFALYSFDFSSPFIIYKDVPIGIILYGDAFTSISSDQVLFNRGVATADCEVAFRISTMSWFRDATADVQFNLYGTPQPPSIQGISSIQGIQSITM